MRDSMALIVAELRVMTDTVDLTDDAAIDYGVWTDDYLQSVLDVSASRQLVDVELRPISDVEGNYTLYETPLGRNVWVEDGAVLVDSQGVQPAGYTIDYQTKLVTFLSDTDGETFYIRGASYDLYEAAAEVWFKKAGLRASMISVKVGDHTLREDQEYIHCMDRYKFYKGARLSHVRLSKAGYARN